MVRLAKLEAVSPDVPRHEECVLALDRLESPPVGYTEADRARDQALIRRADEAAYAAGLG